ncbi:S-adenosylmethionine uptake transporter [Pelomonas saccharophila]|uniref:S-adenosylmethionine uptake transporter n=1 Tax=Roseateles saccharophilus TaxID=304 RepID=A0ABU1YI72_ROSSA|nr:DMT family transporter [Roseateles saccharophilus]MDR7268552.1 S-adenosylmethionine uptake transporter [Roseateles saccharophilus]
MPAPLLMMAATLLFATMGVCVKLASEFYAASEIVMYRGLVGSVMMALLARRQGVGLKTRLPGMHLWRSISGVTSLCLWFYAIGKLPLATAMTLNYMSSVWMALFLLGGAVLMGAQRLDWRLMASVLLGFVGVALILRPTLDQQQLWHGLAGLLSGMIAAMAYLQVTALGRVGEPELRVVFYFSVGGCVAGAVITAIAEGGLHTHTLWSAALLLAVGVLATTAQVCLTRAYSIGRPLVNACLQYLGIVFSFIYGMLLFKDPLTWHAFFGMLLIIGAGIAATLLRAKVAPPAKDSQFNPNET